MRLCLDTNVYSSLARGELRFREAVSIADTLVIPVIVLGELRAGFRSGRRGDENERVLTRFLDSSRVVVLDVDVQTSFHFARIAESLTRDGQLIPTNDMWIAAICVQHGLTLASGDAHFDRVGLLSRLIV